MKHPTSELTALVTGASSGIGLHLAHQFAQHGHPLILVAPEAAELEKLGAEISAKYAVDVETQACDLEDAKAIDALVEAVGDRVDILVNNAGHGFKGNYWEQPIGQVLSMVRLNIEAVLRLTSALLPKMVYRGRGGVLNTASIAGFQPGPTMATYHASKAFVLSWSEALSQELSDTSITVTALCPGPVDTDFFLKSRTENSFAFQKANLMAPQDVAKIGYEAFVKGERVVVAGTINKIMVAGRHFIPESVQAAMNEKMYEDVEPQDAKRERGDKEDAA